MPRLRERVGEGFTIDLMHARWQFAFQNSLPGGWRHAASMGGAEHHQSDPPALCEALHDAEP
jgi:hypothetical protein